MVPTVAQLPNQELAVGYRDLVVDPTDCAFAGSRGLALVEAHQRKRTRLRDWRRRLGRRARSIRLRSDCRQTPSTKSRRRVSAVSRIASASA
jgi:hypothetical protein